MARSSFVFSFFLAACLIPALYASAGTPKSAMQILAESYIDCINSAAGRLGGFKFDVENVLNSCEQAEQTLHREAPETMKVIQEQLIRNAQAIDAYISCLQAQDKNTPHPTDDQSLKACKNEEQVLAGIMPEGAIPKIKDQALRAAPAY